MSDAITTTERYLELARIWEDTAEGITRINPNSEMAKTLAQCVADVRGVAGDTKPRWVSLSDVQRRTRQSMRTLRRRAQSLKAEGQARKSPNWEITYEAAALIPVKAPRIDTTDIHELARHLGRTDKAA